MLKNIFLAKIIALLTLFCVNPCYAEDLNEELAYRVRFSKAGDVHILLGKGADVNYISKSGLPMVSVAVSRKDADALPVLKMLVEAGADINQGGSGNQYPLILALRDNNIAIIKYLAFEKGADLSIKDLNGMTPLEIAEYNANDGALEIIKELKNKQEAQLKELQNPIRRNKIMAKWANLSCEKHYMEHYFAVKLDKKTPEEMKKHLDTYPPQFEEMARDLTANFNIVSDNFGKFVFNFVAPKLDLQFKKMISNRMRRKLGFGTEADMKDKCGKITSDFAKKLPKD